MTRGAASCLAALISGNEPIRGPRVPVVWVRRRRPIRCKVGSIPYSYQICRTVTVLVLAGFVGRSRPPKALGSPFQK